MNGLVIKRHFGHDFHEKKEPESWIIPESKRQLVGRLNRMADLATEMCGAYGKQCHELRKEVRKTKALLKLVIKIA